MCFIELDKNLSPEFFYNYLLAFRRYSKNQAIGATFQNLKTEQIKQWPVLIPTLDEMKKFEATMNSFRDMEISQTQGIVDAKRLFSSLLSKYFHLNLQSEAAELTY